LTFIPTFFYSTKFWNLNGILESKKTKGETADWDFGIFRILGFFGDLKSKKSAVSPLKKTK
jgi:hypothetical protein